MAWIFWILGRHGCRWRSYQGAGEEDVTRPVRLQLSRKKGFNLQEHSRAVNGLAAVNCARPGGLGNPFRKGMAQMSWDGNKAALDKIKDASDAVEHHRRWLVSLLDNDHPGYVETRGTLDGLRGKNLACWCALDKPCHADMLLELANKPPETNP
jgi:Domain of unknown function (DUF4326)